MVFALDHSPATALMVGQAVYVISQFAEQVAANSMAAVCKSFFGV
jgi:hypothetical protein